MRPSGKSIESGEGGDKEAYCDPRFGRKRRKRWPRGRKGTGGWTNSIVVGRLTAIGQERYMYSVTGFNTRRAS